MKFCDTSITDRLGVHTVGLMFQKYGFIFREQPIVDCGIDAQIELVSENNASGKLIALQIKSGVSWFKEKTMDGYIFRGDKNHLEYWLNHSLPVVIVLCDTDSDIAYWQTISKNTISYTKKGWKVTVPYEQQVNVGMHTDLCKLVNQIKILPDYTINQISDSSHGAAKRYSARITLSKEHTQTELLLIIKKLTLEIKQCEYHRSNRTRITWRDNPAHVVWLFIYPSPQDECNNNYLCKSEWISQDLDEKFRPISQDGQSIGDGINVEWNSMYLSTANYNQDNEISKEDFVQVIESLTVDSVELFHHLEIILNKYTESSISYSELYDFIINHKSKASEIYEAGVFIGLSSYECKNVATKFQSMIAYLDNMFILIGHPDDKIVVFNIKNQTKYFIEALSGLKYELDKIV